MLVIIKSLWPNRICPKQLFVVLLLSVYLSGCYDFWFKNVGATYQRAMNLIFYDLLEIILEVYIDNVVVKSDSMDGHLADLCWAIERMCRYGLKMNPLKCAFGVSADKFLWFIIHVHGIEIDPSKEESINKVQAPRCKNDMQKFLEKVNYLRRFISNLSGKISAFVPILRLKNEAEFTLGAKQQRAFEDIKRYLSSPPVMKAPMARIPFRLYIAAEDNVIGVVLMQVTEGKEHIITYLSRRLTNTETMYSFIEKLCLSLLYACSKLRQYLLSSTCVVACQADVIKHMLQQLILSGRIKKWAYALMEYDLAYEPLKSIRGQVVVDFIVKHSIDQNSDESCNLVLIRPSKLFFDGSACREGQGVRIVLISPRGAIFEQSIHLEYFCTNNQAEYEVILLGLQILSSIDVKPTEAFGDSLLVVQQIASTFQRLDGSLNAYLDKWLEIIALSDNFTMQHVSRDENTVVNDLAQQASSFRSNQGKIGFLEKPDVPVCQTGQSGFRPMCSVTICSVEPSPAKLDSPVSETEGSKIFRTSDKSSETMTVDPDD
jgi:ribonuclease HI